MKIVHATCNLRVLVILFCIFLSNACTYADKSTSIFRGMKPPVVASKSTPESYTASIVYALNVGGEDYVSSDNIHYRADNLSISAVKASSVDSKGTQDIPLYQTYRQGDMHLSLPMQNGQYAVKFMFAEPKNTAVGKRLFDVRLEDELHIPSLDVRGERDGKTLSALERTVIDVEVLDGQLDIVLTGVKGEPVLHALVVRKVDTKQTDWQLVWSDEFNYVGPPDPTKWNFDVWPARKVNDEDQAYTERSKNVRVDGQHLIIQAHKEQYDNAQYTSGRIHSKGKGDFLYGKAEVRARIPAGQGGWSAIWMLPSDPFKYATNCKGNDEWQGMANCDAWPNSGEIDIMEYVGYDPTTIHGTVHNKAYYWVNWQQRKGSMQVDASVNTEFQTYSMEWGPDYIFISYNGTPYFYYANEHQGWQSWPYDHPYHLILNLAIGGAWGRAGGPIDDSLFPLQMEVDYVRIYQQQ
ncbi:malectin domain-containing carbohydrate-binding protein [Aliiglaciecola sp. LCG003]|uniref:malectin domain-containing carbohydrate-binding protein n=1 Tax=Aliiglaciecola sp. LCG003 TaxID=3053655 RepID=UPI00257452D9|nr:malectin domain-containing carbohydrate-binding protein [Aliiglaciecola sp. LCG003]WJG10130.1 family 16 glycosylhydrolase [Aliiglaciecola sp. LCG003]